MTTSGSKTPRRNRWWNKPRFDVIETSMLTILLTLIVTVTLAIMPKNREAMAIASAWGPTKYTEGPEEWIVRDFFQDRRDGYFVDIGANHYRRWSKTYYLDSQLGWRGLAVEPQVEFGPDYATYRPRTKFLPFFVSDVSNTQAKVYVLRGNQTVTSGDRGFVEQFGSNPEERSATTITLNDLFAAERVQQIDFLNMDIELWEPKALAGLDLNRYRPELVCIEALPQVRQDILDYFTRHRYVTIGKYLRVDDQNLYFTPLASAQ